MTRKDRIGRKKEVCDIVMDGWMGSRGRRAGFEICVARSLCGLFGFGFGEMDMFPWISLFIYILFVFNRLSSVIVSFSFQLFSFVFRSSFRIGLFSLNVRFDTV